MRCAPTPAREDKTPAYCEDAGHNRAAVWRARRARKASTGAEQVPEDLGGPVKRARTRAAELPDQAQRRPPEPG